MKPGAGAPPVYRPAPTIRAIPIIQGFPAPKAANPRRFMQPSWPVRLPAPGDRVPRVVQRMEVNFPKIDIDPFVMKAVESKSNDKSEVRSQSGQNRYDFRYNPSSYLPDSGPDPTKTKKPGDGYYYHVTSYVNLRNILENGLNPNAGGKVGGSSYQNPEAKMNQVSASDSQSKVFVATASKLTERYLSFRLRQEDLINKHRKWIVNAIGSRKSLWSPKKCEFLLDRFQTGELPLVLRFKNVWSLDRWESDKTDKAAFALLGTSVLPAQIECLSTGGWVPLITLTELKDIFERTELEQNFRSGILTFFGEYNENLQAMNSYEAEHKLQPALEAALEKAGV